MHEVILKWEKYKSNIYCEKKKKESSSTYIYDHHKTWGGKQDRNYFNFTNKDKLRLK